MSSERTPPSDAPSGEDGPPPPRANPDLIGHAAAEGVLLEAFNGGRPAHAWLISGPRGIGKATLAFRFARFLLARGGGDAGTLFAEPPPDSLYVAPDHPVFRRAAAGGHADLLTVERGWDEKKGRLRTEIVVDDVRAVGQFLGLTAAEGGWRVVVIDSADEMNRNAANAVLKVLEEPPRRAVLLLVSHGPGRLLPTIRSRCRRLVLKPLEEDVVASLVAEYRPGLAAEDVAELTRLSEGSVGRALALAADGGLELYRNLVDLLETLPGLDVAALHAFGDRVAKPGADDAFRVVGDLVRWWLGRLILFGARGGKDAGEGMPGRERALIERLFRAGGLDRWLEVWEKTNRLLAQAEESGLDRKQVVLNVFLTLDSAVRP